MVCSELRLDVNHSSCDLFARPRHRCHHADTTAGSYSDANFFFFRYTRIYISIYRYKRTHNTAEVPFTGLDDGDTGLEEADKGLDARGRVEACGEPACFPV